MGIELTTKGEFSQALDIFRSCLQAIPLVALRNQKEQKELQELTKKITEYTLAMRIELERKRLASTVSLF